MLLTLWVTRLVSRKPPSISRVTKKKIVILAHQVLDGLFPRINIKINNGPLANLGTVSCLKKRFDHM